MKGSWVKTRSYGTEPDEEEFFFPRGRRVASFGGTWQSGVSFYGDGLGKRKKKEERLGVRPKTQICSARWAILPNQELPTAGSRGRDSPRWDNRHYAEHPWDQSRADDKILLSVLRPASWCGSFDSRACFFWGGVCWCRRYPRSWRSRVPQGLVKVDDIFRMRMSLKDFKIVIEIS